MLSCTECRCITADAKGWVAVLTDDPDEPGGADTAIYCPVCAEAEFERPPRFEYT